MKDEVINEKECKEIPLQAVAVLSWSHFVVKEREMNEMVSALTN